MSSLSLPLSRRFDTNENIVQFSFAKMKLTDHEADLIKISSSLACKAVAWPQFLWIPAWFRAWLQDVCVCLSHTRTHIMRLHADCFGQKLHEDVLSDIKASWPLQHCLGSFISAMVWDTLDSLPSTSKRYVLLLCSDTHPVNWLFVALVLSEEEWGYSLLISPWY